MDLIHFGDLCLALGGYFKDISTLFLILEASTIFLEPLEATCVRFSILCASSTPSLLGFYFMYTYCMCLWPLYFLMEEFVISPLLRLHLRFEIDLVLFYCRRWIYINNCTASFILMFVLWEKSLLSLIEYQLVLRIVDVSTLLKVFYMINALTYGCGLCYPQIWQVILTCKFGLS